MLLKCEDCGLVFDEDELAEWQEDRGEFWGERCYETLTGCPRCYSGGVREYDKDESEDCDDDC